VDDPLVTEDARALVADLTVRRQSVATAESLTAGLLAATLAGVAGASVVLRGGLVTYIEDTKIALAGVAPQLLDAVGPVAAPTARAMAVGARQRCAATWGVGLTGVAGPSRTAAIRLAPCSWGWPGLWTPMSSSWRCRVHAGTSGLPR